MVGNVTAGATPIAIENPDVFQDSRTYTIRDDEDTDVHAFHSSSHYRENAIKEGDAVIVPGTLDRCVKLTADPSQNLGRQDRARVHVGDRTLQDSELLQEFTAAEADAIISCTGLVQHGCARVRRDFLRLLTALIQGA